MNKEKFEIEVKSIAKTIAAVIIVAIGVRLLTVYLTNEIDLISIIAGALSILILQPAIRHYTRLINILFPDNINPSVKLVNTEYTSFNNYNDEPPMNSI